MFTFALMMTWIGVLPSSNLLGVAGAVATLLAIGLPALKIAERLPSRLFPAYSVVVHLAELISYTAIIHFCGGAEATFLTGTYAAMIAYVGVVMPKPWPFRFALGSSAAYALLVLAEFRGWLDHRPLSPHLHLPPRIQLSYLVVTIAILLAVAYLASQGADLIRKTQQRLREQNADLESATRRAIQSDRLKSEFLANMSHEIRTPLNGVIGMTSLLLNAPLGPDQKHQVETIRASGEALLDVINDVLDLSKAESGVIELENDLFDLRACLADSLSIVAGTARAKGLSLSLSFDEAVPAMLRGDQARVRQIAVNLLGNAVKFTDVGRIDVRVSVVPEGVSRRLRVSVEDTGPGIPQQEVGRHFKPFMQLDSSSTRRFGGTGLGLVISRRLALLMDGDVSYSPRAGGGSVFEFHVLLGPGADSSRLADSPPGAPTPLRSAGPVGPTQQALRVLVVDDNAVNRRVASMMLRTLGHEAELVSDGIEAMEALERKPYDLILMDVQMPHLDGIEATRRIRRRFDGRADGSPWILGVSAHALSTDRSVCLDAGMNDYLTKPFQLEDLEAATRRAAAGIRARKIGS